MNSEKKQDMQLWCLAVVLFLLVIGVDCVIVILCFLCLQAILTRKNHLNGIQYKDDPTIFAWELINEPRCMSDVSGDTLQVSLRVSSSQFRLNCEELDVLFFVL